MSSQEVVPWTGAPGHGPELELNDYLAIFAKRKWIVVGVLALVLAAGVAATVLQQSVYRSDAAVLVRTRETADLFPLDGALPVTRSVAGELAFLNGAPYRAAVTEASPARTSVAIVVDEGNDDVGERSIIRFRASGETAADAAAAANVWADSYVQLRHESARAELDNSIGALESTVAGLLTRRDEVLEPTRSLDDAINATNDPVEIARLGTDRLLLVELASTELNALDTQISGLQGTLSQLRVQSDLLTDPEISARVNEPATPPGRPAEPNVVRNLLLAAVSGLILAVGAALLAETLDSTVKGADEIGEATGLPNIASIPKLKKRGVTLGLDDAHQRVLSGIGLAEVGRGNLRTILVTSANAGEGKSTTAVQLARLSAAGGTRTLLIEGDLYRPTASGRLGISNRVGLADHLDGSRPIDEVIFETPEDDNLDVLPSGRAEPNEVVDLFRSQSFSILLRKVAKRYDRIFIDSAPLLAVADTVEVAAHCDAAVLVVGAGESRGRELTEAMRVLRTSRVDTLGSVLVGATAEMNDVYSYAYSGR